MVKALSGICRVELLSRWEGQQEGDIPAVKPDFGSEAAARRWFANRGYDGLILLTPDQRAAPFFSRTAECPIVIRVHAIDGFSGYTVNRVLECYHNMRYFDTLAPVSGWARDNLLRFICLPELMKVIPNGVDLELLRPKPKDQAKEQVAGLVGVQLRELLPVFYSAFDVYCFPSLVGTESFGMSVLEAMACGTPPVVTDFDGLPEVVGEAGLTVPVHQYDHEIAGLVIDVSAADLSERIRSLIADPEQRRRLGEKARERSLNFGWDAAASMVIETFRELIERKSQNLFARNTGSVHFIRRHDWAADSISTKCYLRSTQFRKEHFEITPEDGIALSLLRTHPVVAVEAALMHVTGDRQKTAEILRRTLALLRNTPSVSTQRYKGE